MKKLINLFVRNVFLDSVYPLWFDESKVTVFGRVEQMQEELQIEMVELFKTKYQAGRF